LRVQQSNTGTIVYDRTRDCVERPHVIRPIRVPLEPGDYFLILVRAMPLRVQLEAGHVYAWKNRGCFRGTVYWFEDETTGWISPGGMNKCPALHWNPPLHGSEMSSPDRVVSRRPAWGDPHRRPRPPSSGGARGISSLGAVAPGGDGAPARVDHRHDRAWDGAVGE
jgi:hypothetical protein